MARMDDGHSTTILFSLDSSTSLWEKEVTPPGIAAGGPIDTTVMANSVWRTMWPKQLKSLTPASFEAAWDPAVYDEIVAMLGTNQQITVTFPDNATLVFWGWLDEFAPNRVVEGEQPTVEVTIEISNSNNAKVETAPVYAAAP